MVWNVRISCNRVQFEGPEADVATRLKWTIGGVCTLTAMVWLVSGCEADLESSCVGGDGTCDGHPMGGPITVVGAGSGGGGAGGGDACAQTCDPSMVSGNTGDFPCEVEEALAVCRNCHTTPAVNGAPFSFDSYDESQQLLGNSSIWFRVIGQIKTDKMPLQGGPLPEAQRQALIEWGCACGPPREMGVTCD